MTQVFEVIRLAVRGFMRQVARKLNKATNGQLHPDVVTIAGLVMHIPIAVLIAMGSYNILAALLLIVFGLFDTLDGELARLQKRSSPRGMLLDASTDRMKEVLLYTGAAYVFAAGNNPTNAAWAVAACGASLCVSYVKAKGEAAVASTKNELTHHELNRLFKDGLLTFELRMTVLVVGLLVGHLTIAVAFIAILAAYTAIWRLVTISKAL
ncbi:MAG TPA: CDP-alcohol phosphatidyltransferase family protein [Candidatus Saccharimonadales bacterium]|nr:CDP-alcohol phosphatidyltransferase family protein [Candidatus Saccharimonadales bacterium]